MTMFPLRHRTRPLRALLHRLRTDDSGLALVEFAYVTPFLLLLITGGTELANYAITSMRISSLAMQVADNASRIGVGDQLEAKKITEAQINDLLQGALAQGGNFNLNGTYQEKQANGSLVAKNKARIIISSLEPDPANVGKNWIRWQRCYGQATEYTPRYGRALANNLTGMGPTGRQAFAAANTAVMFVEVHYRYEPLFPLLTPSMVGLMTYRDMDTVAAMVVRDDRDPSGPSNPENVTISSC